MASDDYTINLHKQFNFPLAYQLYTWYDGEDLAEALTHMSHT